MPSAWGHTRLLETDWRLITQESHLFTCGSVIAQGILQIPKNKERSMFVKTGNFIKLKYQIQWPHRKSANGRSNPIRQATKRTVKRNPYRAVSEELALGVSHQKKAVYSFEL